MSSMAGAHSNINKDDSSGNSNPLQNIDRGSSSRTPQSDCDIGEAKSATASTSSYKPTDSYNKNHIGNNQIASGDHHLVDDNSEIISVQASAADVEDDEYLTQLEKTICSSDEKLCKSCKSIVSASNYLSHLRSCLIKFSCSISDSSDVKSKKPESLNLPESSNEDVLSAFVTKRSTRNRNRAGGAKGQTHETESMPQSLSASSTLTEEKDFSEVAKFRKPSTPKRVRNVAKMFLPKDDMDADKVSSLLDDNLTAEEKCEKYLDMMYSPSKIKAKKVDVAAVSTAPVCEKAADSCQVQARR